MLRYGLLGGARPKMPWELFVTIGAASAGAGLAFAVLFPLWTTYFALGAVELGVFEAIGAGLLTAGWLRRRGASRGAVPPG